MQLLSSKTMSAFKPRQAKWSIPHFITKPTSCTQPGSSPHFSYFRNLAKKKKKAWGESSQCWPYSVTPKLPQTRHKFPVSLSTEALQTWASGSMGKWGLRQKCMHCHFLPCSSHSTLFYCLYLYMLFSYSAPHLRIKGLSRLGEIYK